MIAAAPIEAGATARDEAKAYLRIEGDQEDALIDRLIAAAIGHGEGFTGQTLIARDMRETLPVSGTWQRLGRGPVSAIAGVEALPAGGGEGAPLPVEAFALDIDAAGDGWVRVSAPGAARRIGITYTAGLAATWSGLPEAIRQGAIRLVAHLHAHRDAADDAVPPLAVAALWRPWRRIRL